VITRPQASDRVGDVVERRYDVARLHATVVKYINVSIAFWGHLSTEVFVKVTIFEVTRAAPPCDITVALTMYEVARRASLLHAHLLVR